MIHRIRNQKWFRASREKTDFLLDIILFNDIYFATHSKSSIQEHNQYVSRFEFKTINYCNAILTEKTKKRTPTMSEYCVNDSCSILLTISIYRKIRTSWTEFDYHWAKIPKQTDKQINQSQIFPHKIENWINSIEVNRMQFVGNVFWENLYIYFNPRKKRAHKMKMCHLNKSNVLKWI